MKNSSKVHPKVMYHDVCWMYHEINGDHATANVNTEHVK